MNDKPKQPDSKTPAALHWGLPRRPPLQPTATPKFDPGVACHSAALEAKSTASGSEPKITCPHCRGEIKLTQALAAPLIAESRRQFERQLAARNEDIENREAQLKKERDELAEARMQVSKEVARQLEIERTTISEAEFARAQEAVAEELRGRNQELADMRLFIAGQNKKLAQAQTAQADALRRQRELDEAKREMDLTIEQRVQDALVVVRQKAKLEAEDGLRRRLGEKEAQIAGMQSQIEQLRRKAEQGSQQLQGEALEIELEAGLRARFPSDAIVPVPKGESGGDVLQQIVGPAGRLCGTILWESKRTKNWTHGWLSKLRGDQRAVGADIAMLVSSALPKEVEGFGLVENVWVVAPRFAIPLAIALRQSLIDIDASRTTREGQETKMELVYQYLTGPRFRHRIEAVVERFSEMQSDLERERKVTTRLWAKREEQIKIVLDATAGLYGDLQGIAGRAMQDIQSLDILAIEAPAEPKTRPA